MRIASRKLRAAALAFLSDAISYLTLPLSVMVWGKLPALPLIVSVAGLTGPDAVGLKVTPNLQFLPGAISFPTQVCAAVKSPEADTESMRAHAVSPFGTAMVTVLGLLVLNTRVVGKLTCEGESVATAGPTRVSA